jgi:regulator of sirC expression with transglutaminase-like and TPR domain
MHSDATERFADLAARSDDNIDVAEGALLIAAEEQASLDVADYLERIDALADGMRQAVWRVTNAAERIEALNREFFDEAGFKGNQTDYEDPRNSFLNEVLDRRTGIPITLTILYVEVARRLGMSAVGVGFPGHFLAKIEGVPAPDGNDEMVIDAFFGRTIGLDECQDRLRKMAGREVTMAPDMLRAATSRETLTRVLSNLKNNHLRRGELLEGLSCIDRILMLDPETTFEYRDRGLINMQLGFTAAAASDLERFVDLAPGHESTEQIRETLIRLSQVRSQVH